MIFAAFVRRGRKHRRRRLLFRLYFSPQEPGSRAGTAGRRPDASKAFRVTERVSFEFRAEAFNVSNTPPLNDPNGSFGTPAFGAITTAGNPRDFEFAGKVHF